MARQTRAQIEAVKIGLDLDLGCTCGLLLVSKTRGPAREQIIPRSPQEWADFLVSVICLASLEKDAPMDAETVKQGMQRVLPLAGAMMHRRWQTLAA